MIKKLKNNRGAALLICLAILGMITIVVGMAIDRAGVDVELSYNQLHEEQAFYVADAGTKQVMAQIKGDAKWRDNYDHYSFGDGNFTTTITDSTSDSALIDTLIILSTAEVGQAKSVVELVVVPIPFHPFKWAMFADEFIDIKAMMETDSYNSDSGSYAATLDTLNGDIGSNGTISANMGAIIGGDVLTSELGGLDISGGSTVYGEATDESPTFYADPIAQSEFDWAEANNDNMTGISGAYSYHPITHSFQSNGAVTFTTGTYYFSDISLFNASKLKIAPGDNVTIYVTGKTELKNSASINVGGQPSQCLIYSQGDLVLMNSGDMYASFYSPTGHAELKNSGEYFGSIVSGTIRAHNSSLFHYDRALMDIVRDEIERIDIASWGEIY